ncbi:N-acetyltransferase family protein [Streptomyces sp. NPDC002067]
MTPAATGALTVRAGGAGDLGPVVALHARARAAYDRARHPGDAPGPDTHRPAADRDWRHALAGPDARMLCAERDGTVVGAACHGPAAAPGTVTLHQLQVDPAHWGTGVGHALHTACLRAWRVAGHTAATLDVVWHNRRARAFYAARGWHPDPSRGPAPDATHIGLALVLDDGARRPDARPDARSGGRNR